MSAEQKISPISNVDDPPRAWQRMLSGRRLDILSPSPEDIDINDIAHGLARVARWNGQTHGPNAFSVAQHSLIVEKICNHKNPAWEKRWYRAALLHDAAEYVIGDLISPFKAAIGDNYRQIEAGLMKAIHLRFSLPETLPGDIRREIKLADQISAYFEATRLAGFIEAEAIRYFGNPDGIAAELHDELSSFEPVSTEEAEQAYLDRIEQLADG